MGFLITQATLIINLLRSSRRNPSVSAYAATYGNFDYSATPLAPPGTKVFLHEKPQKRGSWAPHGIDAWYIGPIMEHYRCYKCYIPSTGAMCNADTVEFFPNKYLSRKSQMKHSYAKQQYISLKS